MFFVATMFILLYFPFRFTIDRRKLNVYDICLSRNLILVKKSWFITIKKILKKHLIKQNFLNKFQMKFKSTQREVWIFILLRQLQWFLKISKLSLLISLSLLYHWGFLLWHINNKSFTTLLQWKKLAYSFNEI